MIALTGGAGFLGYHIVNYFHGKSEENRFALIDIADYVESDYPQGTQFLKGDVRDRPRLVELLADRDVDTLIHAAAALPLWKPKDIFSTNVEGTRNVMSVCHELGINRVVYISSTAVYGVPDVHPLHEDHPMVGVGPYGESKVRAEQVCHEFADSEMTISIIRPKNRGVFSSTPNRLNPSPV